ncbi:MAG: translocation/assembly module TamB domain-containing protein [Flavobacteriaceae bacterium]|nr:translocation/assembly module TamB domain-containing protein [Flavobacteriaceae bacterium]
MKYLVLFLVFLVIFFSIPSVQTNLASFVTDNLNEEYGTNLEIKKVDLSLLGSVSLKGIEIRDHHLDTLIFVDRLRTSLLDAKRILENNIQLNNTSLKGVHVYVKNYKGEEIDNLTLFVEKFEDNNPKDSISSPFQIRSSDIYFEDINYKQINENKAVPLDFAAYNGGGSLQDFSVVGPNVALKIRGLYFTDNRGLEITNLTTDFTYTKTKMKFYNTLLQTRHSTISAEIDFNYDRKNLSKFNELVYIDASFKNSYLSTKDLRKLYKEIKGNDVLRFSTTLKGSLNNFSLERLQLNSDKGIKIIGDLNFINAVQQEEFFLTANLEDFSADYFKLKNMLPNLLEKNLPIELSKLGEFSLSGFTKITPSSIEATLDINSEIGDVVADLELKNFHSIDESIYTGEVVLDRFDLGRFFEDSSFGIISFEGEVDGKGFRIENINTKLVGQISQIVFNEYNYKDISVNGLYQNNLFNGKLASTDVNLNGTFEGLADLSEEINKFDFKATINYANLRALNLYDRDSISELKGLIDLDLTGDKIDNIVGIANFKNIMYTNEKDSYSFKQFLIFSTVKENIRQIRIDSEDIIKGELIGDFKFEQMLPLAQNALGSIYSNYTPFKVSPDQFLKFDFVIYNQIVDVFFPQISVAANTKINGNIKANKNQLKLKVTSPKIVAYGTIIDSLSLDTDTKRSLYDTSFSAASIETPYYTLSKLLLFNKTVNDTLFFKSTFKGGLSEKEKFNLDFYYTINEDKKSVLGIEKSTFNYLGNIWDLNPKNNTDNKLLFDLKTNEYVFSPFTLQSKEQEINFKGIIRDSTYKELDVDFTNVYLKSFLPEIDSLKLRGQLDGIINISQVDGIYGPKGNLSVKNFEINNFKQGDLELNIEGESSYKKYDVNFSLEREKVKSISAIGSLDFSETRPKIDVAVYLEEFELDAFSPLGENVLSKIRGIATGDFTLKGFLRNPDMDGELVLENAGLQFPYLNTDYNFNGDASVGLNGQSFEFRNINLVDTKYQSTGFLEGVITHQNFDLWSLNIDILTPNLLILDTKNSDEALYYGTGFIQGNASITGLTNNITIDVNAKTMPNTNFVIPLKDIASIDTYRLIHFKSEKTVEELQEKLAIDAIEGVSLNIDLEVTKDAKAQIVIDEINGSELSGRGLGDLRIEINTNGKFAMFGDYTIDNGIYNFKYGGLINKPFSILKGGTISWSGNPYEANLNVTAVYTTNANPAVLLENFNTNRKIPVDLITNISGSLFNSKQDFDIEIQNSNSTIASELNFVLNDNDVNSKMRQFLTLLAAGTFANPNGGNINGSELLTGTTSNAIGSILSDIISSNKVRLDVGYSTGGVQNPQDDIITDDQFDVSLTTQISKNIIVNGKVGVPVGAQTQSSVVGEVKVEVLLNEAGNFRSVIFNRQNEIQYSAQEEGYTQGIGLSYQVNFNSLSDLLKKIGLKKKQKNKKKVIQKKDSLGSVHQGLLNFKKNN